MFGHAVEVYFKDLFAKHADTLKNLKVNARNGFGDVVSKIKVGVRKQRNDVFFLSTKSFSIVFAYVYV